jgi:hypothetical protein
MRAGLVSLVLITIVVACGPNGVQTVKGPTPTARPSPTRNPPQSLPENAIFDLGRYPTTINRYNVTPRYEGKKTVRMLVDGGGLWGGKKPVELICYLYYGPRINLIEGTTDPSTVQPGQSFTFRGVATFDLPLRAWESEAVACRPWP